MNKDLFGNLIDPEVDYARGNILRDSIAEKLKYQHAVNIISNRIQTHGEDSLYIFTGNHRYNQLSDGDLGIISEEWVGPSLFFSKLKELALAHVGGSIDRHEVAMFNRTSAGTIAAICSLIKPGDVLVSLAPYEKTHPSINRGAKLSGATFHSVATVEELESIPVNNSGVCVITGVTSELHILDNKTFIKAVEMAKTKGMTVFVDDAYGARIRPIILNQPHSLEIGADLIITNNDKAGLHGPRSGIMVGNAELVMKASAKAGELGMEARAPIALGARRSLEKFTPEVLKEEVQVGSELYDGLVREMGGDKVRKTILGPEVTAENLLQFLLEKKSLDHSSCQIVPCEASAALGFIMLERYGIVTVNVGGAPGARVSLRLKSDKKTVSRFGGAHKVIDAVMDSVMMVADMINNQKKMKEIILGS